MKIKSLLIGSAAALVAVSGAQAADAVVSMDPEPVAYVEVCSAAGTGYFYIPGSETCISFGGEVQIDVTYKDSTEAFTASTSADFDVSTYADSELGAITTSYDFGLAQDGTVSGGDLLIGIGAWTVGYADNYLDTAGVGTGKGTVVAYDGGDYTVLATFIDNTGSWDQELAGSVSFDLDPVSLTLAAAYLNGESEIGVRVAMGDLELGYNYDSDYSDQYKLSAEYGVGDFTFEAGFTGDYQNKDGYDILVLEATYEYELATDLTFEAGVEYTDTDDGTTSTDDTVVSFSLERSF